ncbi:MAG: alpha-L-fucosidase [Candidatus Hydrogenedentales bacterium]|jgi:alpha-L-fucosidase
MQSCFSFLILKKIRPLLILLVTIAFLSSTAAAVENWHEHVFFGLHYDLHPGAADTELGRETTYEHIYEMLEKVKPDFVQYDCKGHVGYTGYPTEVGTPSPGIQQDALKIWREVTRDMGIPLSIHYSGVWDTRAIELNPDWARINADGTPDPNYTSRLSAYDDELMIPQLLEVVRNYDIDGMWIDGENWASRPDWSEACQQLFKERTGIDQVPMKAGDPHWHEWLAFHRDLFTEHVTRYTNAVHELKPECMVTSNWMYSVRQPEALNAPIDYLSGDYDPSFGAERAMPEARFLASRGKAWDLMAWSFLQTNNQGWTSKPAVHLCQELATVMAQGGAVFVYNQPQRSGRLTQWHQDILAEVAQFCRARQAYCQNTGTIPQVAVLHSESSYYRYNDPLFNFAQANHPMEGALFALLENGYSVDILNEVTLLERIDAYPFIVIPEAENVSEDMKAALPAYVEKGGQLLLSGAHVADQYGELAGVAKEENSEAAGGWLPAANGAVKVAGAYQPTILQGATSLAPVLYQQEPVLNQHHFSAATVHNYGKGRVAAIHGPLFRNYYQCRYPGQRRFIGDVLSALDTAQLIHVQGPWFIEIAARTKDSNLHIQLINRSSSGYLAHNRHIVEHVPDAGPFTVQIPLAARPSRCYLAPDPVGIDWHWSDGLLTVTIDGLHIYNVLVVEPSFKE